MKRVQIIEDDTVVGELLTTLLQAEGFEASWARSGPEGLKDLPTSRPDLLILDVLLPGLSGLDICRQIRSERGLKRLPVLMLTSKSSETDKVLGLELGADDYLVKPFSAAELIARVRALLRRATPTEEAEPLVTVGDLVLDADSLRVALGGQEVPVTTLEFRLLHFLASHPKRVFSRDRLLKEVWGEGHFVVPRIVDVYIRQLRQKLQATPGAPGLIKTVRGAGYMLEPPADLAPRSR